jgi:3-hydroxymyristoyl/3-hydroxydecanoyl-(acyl carrier protein) dehydratase
MGICLDRLIPLRDIRTTPEGRWESRARFESSCEWFEGHFDGYPLVPGVAFLAILAEAVKKHGLDQGRRLWVFGFSRVRFKRLTLPGEDLQISIKAMPPEPEAELDFSVTCRGETVVQGLLKVKVEGY